MNSKLIVGVALVLAVLLFVNIIAFGFIPDMINGGKSKETNAPIANQKKIVVSNIADIINDTKSTNNKAQPSANSSVSTPNPIQTNESAVNPAAQTTPNQRVARAS